MMDFSRPEIVMKNHLPRLCGSCSELIMPLQSGCCVMMAVSPGLYKVFQGKSVSEVMKWECFQCRFDVWRRVDAPRGCFQ